MEDFLILRIFRVFRFAILSYVSFWVPVEAWVKGLLFGLKYPWVKGN